MDVLLGLTLAFVAIGSFGHIITSNRRLDKLDKFKAAFERKAKDRGFTQEDLNKFYDL